MAAPIKLSSPLLRVVFGDRSDPESWTELEVQTTGADMQGAEGLFARHKEWGTPQKRPVKFQYALAWFALRATGQYPGQFTDFEAEALEVADPEDEEEVADPTQLDLGAD